MLAGLDPTAALSPSSARSCRSWWRDERPHCRIGHGSACSDALERRVTGDCRGSSLRGWVAGRTLCARIGCRVGGELAISTYDPATDHFSLSPEQAMVFTVGAARAFFGRLSIVVATMIEVASRKVDAGVPHGPRRRWGDHRCCLFCATRLLLPSGLCQQHRPELYFCAERVEERVKQGAARGRRGCCVRLLDAA